MSSTESSRDEAADLFNSSSLRFDARCLASAASSLACSFLKSVQLASHLLFKLFSSRSKSLVSSFKVLCSRSKVAILAFNLACLVRASDNFRKLDRAGFDCSDCSLKVFNLISKFVLLVLKSLQSLGPLGYLAVELPDLIGLELANRFVTFHGLAILALHAALHAVLRRDVLVELVLELSQRLTVRKNFFHDRLPSLIGVKPKCAW